MPSTPILDEFIDDFALDRSTDLSVVTAGDLAQLKSLGHSVEELLDRYVKHHKGLLHGSPDIISDSYLKPNNEGELYATNLAAIALMKSVVSNSGLKHPGLSYPYIIDDEHPLVLRIHGMHDETLREKGFVYILNQTKDFVNDPYDSWQYLKHDSAPIAAQLEVEKTDFSYPILDMTGNKQVQ